MAEITIQGYIYTLVPIYYYNGQFRTEAAWAPRAGDDDGFYGYVLRLKP